MTERPILFSAPMVLALLAGTKQQTRRILKAGGGQQRKWLTTDLISEVPRVTVYPRGIQTVGPGVQLDHPAGGRGSPLGYVTSPYGGVGDRLWVRETWAYRGQSSRNTGPKRSRREGFVTYAADGTKATIPCGDGPTMLPCPKQHVPERREGEEEWEHADRKGDYYQRYFKVMRPSIFMPRWASRLTLEVVAVRVERLQAISEADAKAEGAEMNVIGHGPITAADLQAEPGYWSDRLYRNGYEALWESINGAGSWSANPWVWVVEFKRVMP